MHPWLNLLRSVCRAQAAVCPPITVRGALCTCTGEVTPTVAVIVALTAVPGPLVAVAGPAVLVG